MNRIFTLALTLIIPAVLAVPASASQYLHTQYTFTDRTPESGDALVLLVPRDETAPALDGWSPATREHVSRAIGAGGFTPTAGTELEILAPAELDFGRLILVGMGAVATMERHRAELIGASLSERLNATDAGAVVVSSALLEETEAGAALTAAVAHGLDLRNYRFDRFMSDPSPRPAQTITWQSGSPDAVEGRYQLLRALAEGVFTARELTNLRVGSGTRKPSRTTPGRCWSPWALR
jgi:leucyl aminopeptidase